MNISKYLRLEDISEDGLQVPETPFYNVLLVSSQLKECASFFKQLSESKSKQITFSIIAQSNDLAISTIAAEAAIVSIEPQQGKELIHLTNLRKQAPEMPVLVLSDYKHKDFAAQAIKGGAQDFIVLDASTPLELLKMRVVSVIEQKLGQDKKFEFARLEKFVMRSVLENSPLMFVRFDHSFRIIDCNRYFEQKIGEQRQVLRGRSLFEVLQQIELPEFQRLAQGGEVLGKRLTLRDENNSFEDMYLNLFGWSFGRANGKDSEIILVGVDITGAIKAKFLQEEFVAAIAHDLRNPVLGQEQVFAAIMDKKQNPFGDLNASLQAVRSSNLKVLQLLDTLLDVYKLDSSESLTRCEGACFNEAVQSQIEEMKVVADTSNQKICLNLEENLPKAAIDQVSAFRIASNLLFNALKNSPPKAEILINTKANDEFVFLEISNPSLIPLNLELTSLFERFSFADQSEGGRRTTSGLGLYFCKKTLDRYGGNISCIQEEGSPGAVTFIVSVPVLKD